MILKENNIFVEFIGSAETAKQCENAVRTFINEYIDDIYFVVIYEDMHPEDGFNYLSMVLPGASLSESFYSDIMQKEWEGKKDGITINFYESVKEINVEESDLKWDLISSHRPGGQVCGLPNYHVQVTHIPTDITVKCDAARNTIENKEIALQFLMAKVENHESN